MINVYRLDMLAGSSLIDHEFIFYSLVQNLADIGKTFDREAHHSLRQFPLLPETFGNWIQGQMTFIDAPCQSPTSKVAQEKKQDV